MNERIRCLAVIAKQYAIAQKAHKGIEGLFMHDDFVNKFSELIIRDVIDTTIISQFYSPDYEWTMLNNYGLEMEDREFHDPEPDGISVLSQFTKKAN